MYFPRLLAAVLVGMMAHLTSAAPASAPVDQVSGLTKRYTPGWCCVDVIQHWKPYSGSNRYGFDITVKDGSGAVVGGSAGQVGFPGQAINQFSRLPWRLLVTAGGAEGDPVSFAYAGAHWDSNSGCLVRRNGSGSRQISCRFSC